MTISQNKTEISPLNRDNYWDGVKLCLHLSISSKYASTCKSTFKLSFQGTNKKADSYKTS